MTGFMVRSNGALVIFVYFYQLGNGVNFHTFLLTYIFLLSLKMHDSNLMLKVYYLRALTSLLIGLGLGTVPRSMKSKADHSRLEETVSKRKKPSN